MRNRSTKRLMSLLMVILLALTMAPVTTTNAATVRERAIEAYKAKMKSTDVKLYAYAQIDHDKNQIPELFVRDSNNNQKVFTYYKGKVKLMRSFGPSYMLQYYKKGNILCVGHMVGGMFEEGVFQLKKGKLKSVAYLYESMRGGSKYIVKKKKVSRGKFNKYVKKISKKSKAVDIKYNTYKKP